jgi:hypothetical protein
MDDVIKRALAADRTVDLTTTGRTSGAPRRIEIWQHQLEGGTYITGLPGKRGWYANVLADPHVVLHLKTSAQADLPAIAHPVTDERRRRELMGALFERTGRDRSELARWVAESPMVELEFSAGG